MEEFELSEQCRLGNNRARKELYEHYGGRLLGVCLRYTGGVKAHCGPGWNE